MKLVGLLVLIGVISTAIYYFFLKVLTRVKKHKGANQKAVGASAIVAILLLGLLFSAMYQSAKAPDMQCGSYHQTTSYPPTNLTTAMDYFTQGNYDYDTGNCAKAISAYTASIQLNPNYPEAYNNRAYTYMRMRDYQDALPDLDKALAFNPNYIQALMNRADIHNYYFKIDKQSAIADYEKVISLGGNQQNLSVCGHLFLARHNGWNLGTFLDLPNRMMDCN